jgi:transcription initiation factor TFIIIB Brf1 subunit/transcription initiation factor TFIIB
VTVIDAEPDELPDDIPACPHPPAARRLEDGEQVCRACGEVVTDGQVIVPKERPGTTDPTQREGDERAKGGLRHITWDPANPAASRPYTPEEVELELVDTLDRIERGAGWFTTQEEKRSAAKLKYELEYARARFTSEARTVAEREDDATIKCAQLYEEWQLLELTCRTAKEGLHNLRSKAIALMSIMKSVGTAAQGGGGWR